MIIRTALGAMLITSATAASAQAGAAAGERRLDIRPSVQLVYDDNVFRAPESFDLGNRSRDDMRVTPGVVADIAVPVGRQTLFLNGSVGYDFFANNSQLDRERIGLSGGANLRARSCSSTITGRYNRQQTDFANILATVAIPNADERRVFDVQLQCAGAVGLAPSVGFTRSVVRNSSTLFQPLDVNSNTFTAAVGYQRPSFGLLSLYGTYSTAEFPNRRFLLPGETDPVTDGIDSYSVGVSFERQIGSRITGSLSFGHTWVNPKLDQTVEFTGLSYSAGIDLRPGDALLLNLTAARTIDVQNIVAASYAITDLFSLAGTYQFSQRMSLNFGSRYQERRFRAAPQLEGLPGFLLVPDDQLISATIGLGYDIGDRLRLTTGFTQERRKSDLNFFNFNNTRLEAGLSLQL